MSYLDQVAKPGQTVNSLFNFLGVIVDTISPEKAILRLPFQDGFIQGAGIIAGGIIATLLDETMAHLVLAHLGDTKTTKISTVTFSVHYLAEAKAHQELIATATMMKKGQRILFVEAEIAIQARLIAKGTASFLVRL